MEKPLLVLRPKIIDAVLPTFLKNLIRALAIGGIVYAIAYVFTTLKVIQYPQQQINYFVISAIGVLCIVPVVVRLIILKNVRYYFHKALVMSEFELFKVDRHSVPYSQITHLGLKVTMWDRICNSGDITLFTGHEQKPSLTLYFVHSPKKVEEFIYKLMHASKAQYYKQK